MTSRPHSARAWRRPPGDGAKNKGRGAVWVAGLIAMLLLASIGKWLGDGTGQVFTWAIGLCDTSGLWW